jgi:transcriptional regulator with XRE-family HTH domain
VAVMNIGKKIASLKENLGFKNYAEFGKAIGLSGDWLLELSKKETVSTIDVSRLIVIADYAHISLDYLLRDSEDAGTICKQGELAEDDTGVMLDRVQDQLKEDDLMFYGFCIGKDVSKLAIDAIDVVKMLIKQNI